MSTDTFSGSTKAILVVVVREAVDLYGSPFESVPENQYGVQDSKV